MIVKQGQQYVVKTKSGRIMGKYATRTAAEERLRQIEMFKHMKK